MVEKMKFLSITGHKGDIDRVVDQYFSRYEIHLENALSELKTVPNLRPFTENNPYKEELIKSEDLIRTYLHEPVKIVLLPPIPHNFRSFPQKRQQRSFRH